MTADGPIELEHWRDTPAVSGRTANDADVNAGRAVFAVGGVPVEIDLPAPAIIAEEEIGEPTPVIVIQAERLEDGTIAVGYRFLDGGTGIAEWDEVEFLSEPDERFK